jgi:hypothetical protein
MSQHSSLQRGVRFGVIGSASLLVLVAAAMYVLIPDNARIALTVRAGTDPASVVQLSGSYVERVASERAVAGRAKARDEVVYGTIAAKGGVHVASTTVRLVGTGKADRGQSAIVHIGHTGKYRSVVHLAGGRYRVVLTLLANGHSLTARKQLRLRVSKAYEIAALVSSGRAFALLPITSY